MDAFYTSGGSNAIIPNYVGCRLRLAIYANHPIRLIGHSVSNPREYKPEKQMWEQLRFEFSDWK